MNKKIFFGKKSNKVEKNNINEMENKELQKDKHDECIVDDLGLMVFASLDAAKTNDDKLREYASFKEMPCFETLPKDGLVGILTTFDMEHEFYKVVYISEGMNMSTTVYDDINVSADVIWLNFGKSTALAIKTDDGVEEFLYSKENNTIIIKLPLSYIIIYDDGVETF